MNKIEFSDINKFLTSLGLIFIGAAVFLPWFVNQNISTLVIEADTLKTSSCTLKKILYNQQQFIFAISNNLIPIVLGLLLIGITLIIIGIVRWVKRQKVVDELQDEELKSKKQQNVSQAQKKEIIESELERAGQQNAADFITKYINFENIIGLKLSQHYTVNYITQQNIRIGQFNYDIILKSKYISKREDIIFEIKHYNKKISYTDLLDTVNRLLLAQNHYDKVLNRMSTAIVIIIHNGATSTEILNHHKQELNKYLKSIQRNLRVKFIQENDIQNAEAPVFLQDDLNGSH